MSESTEPTGKAPHQNGERNAETTAGATAGFTPGTTPATTESGTHAPAEQPGSFRMPLGESGRRAWRNLVGSFRFIEEQLATRLTPFAVAPREVSILIMLAEAGGRAKMGALAQACFLSASNLSHRVKRLEVKGLLRRESDPEDGRGTVTVFTEEGRQLFDQVLPVYMSVVQENYLERMDEEEQDVVADLLFKVNPSLLEPLA